MVEGFRILKAGGQNKNAPRRARPKGANFLQVCSFFCFFQKVVSICPRLSRFFSEKFCIFATE